MEQGFETNTDGKAPYGPQRILERHRRMAARIEELRTNGAVRPEPGPRAIASLSRDAFFASTSRELRWALDQEGRLQLVDGAWQTVLGWLPEQLQGWYWEEIVFSGDRVRVGEVLSRVAAGGAPEHDVEVRLALAGGGHRLTLWSFQAGSGTDSILGLGRDATELEVQPTKQPPRLLQRRNAKLAARLSELEANYSAVDRFAGTAAHQLAEPLVIAESSAILLAEELGADLDPMLRSRLDAIGRGAARARRLMDALLVDARTGGCPPVLRPVALASVVDETLASLEHQIQERSASVVVVPLPQVHGDPGLLSVVFDNLVSNALKYGPRSGGRVDITAERIADRVRISVASGGMPIPADQAERIFQPFHRVPGERRVPGIGLGLTICARLMERLDGEIGVEPGAEGGNAFWIDLRPAA